MGTGCLEGVAAASGATMATCMMADELLAIKADRPLAIKAGEPLTAKSG